ncbi:CLUMA_CG019493, isoform A [Clunio marinus]|uniref:CLUMA_CG019493, isoform A n=1 Tax=Clunio marinus TaxID=568069 RepID=A0A1J1J4E0_9DIPT|nr:CLUMA_CG019493, isoform A [Clunio marinus]
MITVERFLCWDLEVGGLAIGWFYFICSIISCVLLAFGAAGVLFADCQTLTNNQDVSCGAIRAGIFVGVLIAFLILLLFVYLARLLINGTKERNDSRVKPMMIVFGIFAVLSIFGIFSLQSKKIASSILSVILYSYGFVVLFSLYDRFRMEHNFESDLLVRSEILIRMITVDKCLCCGLETGALVIGWLNLIGNILGVIVIAISLFGIFVSGCDEIKKAAMQDETFKDLGIDGCTLRIVFVVALIVGLILCIALASFSYLLIQGTKKRNHVRVKPMMIVMAIGAILSFLGLLTFNPQEMVSSAISGLIYAYFFVVLFSLYEIFRMEKERGMTLQPQYQASAQEGYFQPPPKV